MSAASQRSAHPPWLAVHASAVNSVAKLTVRLRLGPRSRDLNHLRTKKSAREPSYYDLMAMEGGNEKG